MNILDDLQEGDILSIKFKKLIENNLPPTDFNGVVTFTDEQNLYISKQDGAQMKIGDVMLCTNLPQRGIEGKLYLMYDINQDIFSLYAWNGIEFKQLTLSN